MNSKDSFKIAIIGCGQMARVHARLLKKRLPLDQVAACDKDALRLSEFGKMTGIKNLFSDIEVLFKEFKPDIVHIVTPPGSHKALAILCIQRGADVLIEKPICLTSTDAEDVIACAHQHKKLVCVDHMRSFDPLTQKAKALIEKKKMGNVVNVSVHYSYDYLQRMDSDPAARWIKALPGGSFFDLMPHVLCLLKDFLPNLKLDNKLLQFNDDGLLTDLQCVFSSGRSTGHLHMTLRALPLKNFIEIECERGMVRVDYRNFLVIHRHVTGLPNFVERILGNVSVGGQYLFGTAAVVFKALLGRLDPYAGLDVIIQKFMESVSLRNHAPVEGSVGKDLLKVTEDIFGAAGEIVEESHSLKPSDVLVTGGTGFIGRRLVRRLLEKGVKVRILTHRPFKKEQAIAWFGGEVDIFRGNIYNPKDALQAMDGVKKVYHLAAAMKGDWTNHLDTTITGTQNILRAAHAKSVKDIVYMSTLNVYAAADYPEGREINEHFPNERHPERRGAYSHAKLLAEYYVRQFASDHPDVRISVFRPGLVYGPGGKTFFNDVGIRVGKGLVVVLGLGFRKLPLVYVDNVIDALTADNNSTGSSISFFNVVDGDYPDQHQYIKHYCRLTGEKFFVICIPLFIVAAGFGILDLFMRLIFRKKTTLFYKLLCVSSSPRHSTANAEKLLNWKQKVSFEEGLSLTVNAK